MDDIEGAGKLFAPLALMFSSPLRVPRPARKETADPAGSAKNDEALVEDVITPTIVDPPRLEDSFDAPVGEVAAKWTAPKPPDPKATSVPGNGPGWIADVPATHASPTASRDDELSDKHVRALFSASGPNETDLVVPSPHPREPSLPPRESYPPAPLRESYPPPSVSGNMRARVANHVSSMPPPVLMIDERDGSHWRRTIAFREGFGSRAAAWIASGAVVVTAGFAVVASLVVLARSNEVPRAPAPPHAVSAPPAESPQMTGSNAPAHSSASTATAPTPPAPSSSATLRLRSR